MLMAASWPSNSEAAVTILNGTAGSATGTECRVAGRFIGLLMMPHRRRAALATGHSI
jgi:hypothetical protein